jgi:hypothetical protein
MTRTLRVLYVESAWVVMMPDGKIIDAKYHNEESAVALCTGIASTVKPAQILIHNKDGRVARKIEF